MKSPTNFTSIEQLAIEYYLSCIYKSKDEQNRKKILFETIKKHLRGKDAKT